MPPSSKPDADWMSAYLDAELPEEQAEAFSSFLADNEEAQHELEDLRRMLALVGSLPRAEAPTDFSDKVLRKLRRRRGRERLGLLLQTAAVPFQVLSILVILAIAALMMLSELEQRPTALQRDAVVEPEGSPEQLPPKPPS